MDLKQRIEADLKQAMRDKDRARLDPLRMLRAAIQRREVDERTSLDESQVLAVVEKLVKQGRDAADQFAKGGRQDLVDKEQSDLAIYAAYLPEPLSDAEIQDLIATAIGETGATSVKDMGKVMASLKSALQGRADMSQVSRRVKETLAAGS